MGSETRKRTVRITIRMTLEEKAYLDLLSKQTYLSIPELLRRSILNQTIESKIAHSVYEALLHLKTELGRIRELLKLWLSKTELETQQDVPELIIRQILRDLELNQGEIMAKLKKL